jgi:sugar/nucleoside kinase (ribokinase family)
MSLRKLGNDVGLMGLVGDDAQGRFIRERCAASGISSDTVGVAAGVPTATGLVLIEAGGERSFLAPRSSSRLVLGLEHVDLGRIRPGLRVLSIGSLFWAPRFDREAVVPLLRKAKSVGATTVADMVMDERGRGLDDLAEAWPYLDYAMPSQLEGEVFVGSETPEEIAAAFRRRGVRNVVLKRGTGGSVAFVDDNVVSCPAFNVDAVDTTGAGDNFVAGFIHGLAHDLEIDESLRFASAVAALSIQAVGAGAGLTDLRQVEEFLENS